MKRDVLAVSLPAFAPNVPVGSLRSRRRQTSTEALQVRQGDWQAAQLTGELSAASCSATNPPAHSVHTLAERQLAHPYPQFSQVDEDVRYWASEQAVQVEVAVTSQRAQFESHAMHCSWEERE